MKNNGRNGKLPHSALAEPECVQQAGFCGQQPETHDNKKNERGNEPKSLKEKLLETLATKHLTETTYYERLSSEILSETKKNASVVADSALLAKLNSEELPKSYAAIEARRATLETLSREAKEFQNPPRKPDISRVNYLNQYKEIISGYGRFYAAGFRRAMKGRKRTLDDVLRETATAIGALQQETEKAIRHSQRVIDGLTSYQEDVVEARIRDAGKSWESSCGSSTLADKLLGSIDEHEDSCTQDEYSTLSVSKRNLKRLRQYSEARMKQTEAVAVQGNKTLFAVNSLEDNLREGVLKLLELSSIVANTVEDVQYSAEGVSLLKHGYKHANAICEAAEKMRGIVDYQIKDIKTAITSFGDKLDSAQKSINESQEAEKAKASEPQPSIRAGASHERTHEEAMQIFAKRGVAYARKIQQRYAAD